MARTRDIRSKDDFPDWMKELKGFEALETSTEGDSDGETWRFQLTLPTDMAALVEQIDPLIILAVLLGGIGQIEEKIGEIVRFCRAQGRTWTQIGEALGMTKQAAWERFSGEE